MDASEPPRKNTQPKQISVEILGAVIALTTLVLPIVLITNLSNGYRPSSLSARTDVLSLKK